MGIISNFISYFSAHPFLMLLYLILWVFLGDLLVKPFLRYNTKFSNAITITSILLGAERAGYSAPTKYREKYSMEHLNTPKFFLVGKVGAFLLFLIFSFIIAIIFINIFTFVGSILVSIFMFVTSILNTLLMFGFFGLIMYLLFWAAVALAIGSLF